MQWYGYLNMGTYIRLHLWITVDLLAFISYIFGHWIMWYLMTKLLWSSFYCLYKESNNMVIVYGIIVSALWVAYICFRGSAYRETQTLREWWSGRTFLWSSVQRRRDRDVKEEFPTAEVCLRLCKKIDCVSICKTFRKYFQSS